MTLVILAAGMGSRYGGMKQIDPIGNNGEFIIDYTIYDAIKAGFDKAVIIVKKENIDAFRETVGARVESKIDVEYVFQEGNDLPKGFKIPEGRVKPWGTGHAVLAARHVVKDNFAVVNADDFYGRDAFIKLAAHLKNAETKNGVAECCMIGYKLSNTLTENGSVSRGQCEVNDNGDLISIVERTKIIKSDEKALYEADNGEWTELPLDTTVSMNCFGFTPAIFEHFWNGFEKFMAEKGNEMKSEFYCPAAVFDMINKKQATVRVYNTTANWFGVTYHEDKPRVVSAIRQLIECGEYPNDLWN